VIRPLRYVYGRVNTQDTHSLGECKYYGRKSWEVLTKALIYFTERLVIPSNNITYGAWDEHTAGHVNKPPNSSPPPQVVAPQTVAVTEGIPEGIPHTIAVDKDMTTGPGMSLTKIPTPVS